MARRFIGLDLGTYSVKALRIEGGKRQERFRVLDAVEEILPLDDNEQETLGDKQNKAILSLQRQGFLDGDACFMALPSSKTNMRMLEVPFLESNKIEAILPGVLENEIPFPLDEVIYSWNIENKGLEDKPENYSIRIGFAQKESIQSFLSNLQPLGIDPRILHLNPSVYFELPREFGFKAFLEDDNSLALIIDFAHTSTNFLIFNNNGILLTKTVLHGGENLTKSIAETLNISFNDAQHLKHNYQNIIDFDKDKQDKVDRIFSDYMKEILNEITRLNAYFKWRNEGPIGSLLPVGGAIKLFGLNDFLKNNLNEFNINIISLNHVSRHLSDPSMTQAFSLAISGLHIHSKDSRFNFRKSEFVWRGSFDFIRIHRLALMMWGFGIVCSLVILWSTWAMILDKEGQVVERKLKDACAQILGQKNVAPNKCLPMMKEQINTSIDLGVPEYSATNVYIDAAKNLDTSLSLLVTEMDILENKVKIKGEVSNFEDVDKVVAKLKNIPCFSKVEKSGKVQMKGTMVEFQVGSDIDCSPKKEAHKQP